jgi:hypothetical protein
MVNQRGSPTPGEHTTKVPEHACSSREEGASTISTQESIRPMETYRMTPDRIFGIDTLLSLWDNENPFSTGSPEEAKKFVRRFSVNSTMGSGIV